jgi:hypothetical protein
MLGLLWERLFASASSSSSSPWTDADLAALIASHERERKSALETVALLAFETVILFLPGRDLSALACASWTLFNRCAADRVWKALFDDYLTTLPFILVHAPTLQTFRERVVKSRKCLTLQEAFDVACDGDIVRLPMGRINLRNERFVVRKRIVLEGTRLVEQNGELCVYHRATLSMPAFVDEWTTSTVSEHDWHSPLSRRVWPEIEPPSNFVMPDGDAEREVLAPGAPPVRVGTAPPTTSLPDREMIEAFDNKRIWATARVAANEVLSPLDRFLGTVEALDDAALAAEASTVSSKLARLIAATQRKLQHVQPLHLAVPRRKHFTMVSLFRAIKRANVRVSKLGTRLAAVAREQSDDASRAVSGVFRDLTFGTVSLVWRIENPSALTSSALATSDVAIGPTWLTSTLVSLQMSVTAPRFAMLDVHMYTLGVGVSFDGTAAVQLHNCWFSGGTALRFDATERRSRVSMTHCALSNANHGATMIGDGLTLTMHRCILSHLRRRAIVFDGSGRLALRECRLENNNGGIDVHATRDALLSRLRYARVSVSSSPLLGLGELFATAAQKNAAVQDYARDLCKPTPELRTALFVIDCVFENNQLYGVYVRRSKALIASSLIDGSECSMFSFASDVDLFECRFTNPHAAAVVIDSSMMRASRSTFDGDTVGAVLQATQSSTLALSGCLVRGSSALRLCDSYASAQQSRFVASPNAMARAGALLRLVRASMLALDDGCVLSLRAVASGVSEVDNSAVLLAQCASIESN